MTPDERILKAEQMKASELTSIRRLLYMKAAREAWVISDDEYQEFLLKAVKPIREMMKGER